MAAKNHVKVLDVEADTALFQRDVDGLVVLSYQNERPLQGLLGLLDWRFGGAFTDSIRLGALTGSAGEVLYHPIPKNGEIFHFIVVGAGKTSEPGERPEVNEKVIKPLIKNLKTLGLKKLGLSLKDFGKISASDVSRWQNEVPLCVCE